MIPSAVASQKATYFQHQISPVTPTTCSMMDLPQGHHGFGILVRQIRRWRHAGEPATVNAFVVIIVTTASLVTSNTSRAWELLVALDLELVASLTAKKGPLTPATGLLLMNTSWPRKCLRADRFLRTWLASCRSRSDVSRGRARARLDSGMSLKPARRKVLMANGRVRTCARQYRRCETFASARLALLLMPLLMVPSRMNGQVAKARRR